MKNSILNTIGILFSIFASAQTPTLPPGPTAAGLGQYAAEPVNTYNGTISTGVPIYNVQHHDISVPIGLSYHGSGVKVAEVSSWVGMKWSLNAGGLITRQVRGLDDFADSGYLEIAPFVNDLNTPFDQKCQFLGSLNTGVPAFDFKYKDGSIYLSDGCSGWYPCETCTSNLGSIQLITIGDGIFYNEYDVINGQIHTIYGSAGTVTSLTEMYDDYQEAMSQIGDLPDGYLDWLDFYIRMNGLPLNNQFPLTYPSLTENISFLREINEGKWDLEPDLFYFNFQGNSGSFYFNENGEVVNASSQQDLKIELESNLPIPTWRITDPNGFVYLFEVNETQNVTTERTVEKLPHAISGEAGSSETSSTDYEYISSWVLVSIASPKNNLVEFNYNHAYETSMTPSTDEYYYDIDDFTYDVNDFPIRTHPIYPEELGDYMLPGNEVALYEGILDISQTNPSVPSDSICQNSLMETSGIYDIIGQDIRIQTKITGTSSGHYLSSITYGDYSVAFMASNNRCDNHGDLRLEEIEVLHMSETLKKWELSYKYTESEGDVYFGGDTFNIPSSNGFVENFSNYCFDAPILTDEHFTFLRRMWLTGVKELSPTGIGYLPGHSFEYYVDPVSGVPELGSRYTKDHDWWGYANNSDNGLNVMPQDLPNFDINSAYSNMGALKRITYPTGGNTLYIYESNKVGVDLVGGIRIKQVTVFDGTSILNNQLTNFEYVGGKLMHPYMTQESDAFVQGGPIVMRGLGDCSINNNPCNANNIFPNNIEYFNMIYTGKLYSSFNQKPLSNSAQGAAVGYDNVTVYSGEKYNGVNQIKVNGKQEYFFLNDPDETINNTPSIGILGTIYEPLNTPVRNHAATNGYITEVKSFKFDAGSYKLIDSTINHYEIKFDDVGTRGYRTFGSMVDSSAMAFLAGVDQNLFTSCPLETTISIWNDGQFHNITVENAPTVAAGVFECAECKEFKIYDYPILREHIRLDSVTNSSILDNGTWVNNTVGYTYISGLYSMYPRTVTSTNSDGTILRQTNFRPFNCEATLPIAAEMMSKHIHTPVLETLIEQQKPGEAFKTIGASYTEYNIVTHPGQLNNKILPTASYSAFFKEPSSTFVPIKVTGVIAPQYERQIVFDEYDRNGSLIQTHQENGVATSFIYGNNQTTPVASATNAERSGKLIENVQNTDFTYLSFETGLEDLNNPDEDYWEFNTVNVNDDNISYTGGFSRKIISNVGTDGLGNPGYGPKKVIRPINQNQKFLVSAWVRTGSGAPLNSGNGKLNVYVIDNDLNTPTTVPIPSTPYLEKSFSNTNGEWQYIELEVDLKKIREDLGYTSTQKVQLVTRVYNSNEGGIGSLNRSFWVDDIRIRPVLSVMNTLTFHPIVGVTSTLDNNNIASNFEYDNFSRLLTTRDHNNDILSHTRYYLPNYSVGTFQPNFVQTIVPTISVKDVTLLNSLSKDERAVSKQYMDGLGRNILGINFESSPLGNDVVSFTEYDNFGRVPKAFSSYTRPTNNGAFINLSTLVSEQTNFYLTADRIKHTGYPYALSEFEQSSRGRVLEQGGIGEDWQLVNGPGKGNTVTTEVYTNDGVSHPDVAIDFLSLIDRKWSLDSNGKPICSNEHYPANSLSVIKTIDQHGNPSFSISDKSGKSLCSYSENEMGNGTTQVLVTYNVYDDMGRLRWVIPPKQVKAAIDNHPFDWHLTSTSTIENCFEYHYDYKGRLNSKRVPQGSTVEFVYDNLNRIVLARDGKDKQVHEWSFTKYDKLGRTILTGTYSKTGDGSPTGGSLIGGLDYMRDRAVMHYTAGNPNYEDREFATTPGHFGYADQAFPILNGYGTTHEIYTANYFDDYDSNFDGTEEFPYINDSDFPNTPFKRILGKPTMSKVKILNRPGEIEVALNYTLSASYYDDFGRVIQTQRMNTLSSNVIEAILAPEVSFVEYDFAGQITRNRDYHRKGHTDEHVLTHRYDYDHAGRSIKKYRQIDSEPEFIVSADKYNELSELIETNTHSTNGSLFLQSTDFSYNELGWLTHINRCDLGNDLGFSDDHVDDIVKKAGLVINNAYGAAPTNNANLSIDVDFEVTTSKGKTLMTTAIPLSKIAVPSGTGFEQVKPQLYSTVDVALTGKGINNNNIVSATVCSLSECGEIKAANAPGNSGNATDPFDYNDDDSDLFGMRIYYQENAPTNLNAETRYDGTVTAICYGTAYNRLHAGYGFQYDEAGQLEQAHYAEESLGNWTKNVGRYDVNNLSYDYNGNILSAQRAGYSADPTLVDPFTMIDLLNYSYDGNQLMTVSDMGSNGKQDFRDSATLAVEYLYDINGNMSFDYNKNLAMEYNKLDLPERIVSGTMGEVLYLYDAVGTKIKTISIDKSTPVPTATETHYSGGYIYENGVLKSVQTAEGRLFYDPTTPSGLNSEYNMVDHLGNVRLTYADLNGNGSISTLDEIMQEKHYYPFGMVHGGQSQAPTIQQTPYLFNGKELESDFGINLYDYGLRYYDVQLARWHAVDPSAESYLAWSPYNYVYNDPANFVDPDGADPICCGNNPTITVSSENYDPSYDFPTGGYSTIENGNIHSYTWVEGFISATGSGDFQRYITTLGHYSNQNIGPAPLPIHEISPMPIPSLSRNPIENDVLPNFDLEDFYYSLPNSTEMYGMFKKGITPVATYTSLGGAGIDIGYHSTKYVSSLNNYGTTIKKGLNKIFPHKYFGKNFSTKGVTKKFMKMSKGVKIAGTVVGVGAVTLGLIDQVVNYHEKSNMDRISYAVGVTVFAVAFSMPLVGVLYGGSQMVSYLSNGKNLEQNVHDLIYGEGSFAD